MQVGGFDTHASQDTTSDAGAYVKLMVMLNDGLSALYTDLRNTGLINDTLLLSFSEFGRRVAENGSKGTDHGSASVMLAMGGGVRGEKERQQGPSGGSDAQGLLLTSRFRASSSSAGSHWAGS